jgi:transcriptional regulator with XRE-family HTH domain
MEKKEKETPPQDDLLLLFGESWLVVYTRRMPLYKNKLVQYRLKYRFTQQEVIKKLNLVSTSRLSSWEQGKSMPSLPNLFLLCTLYNTTSEKLYPSLILSMDTSAKIKTNYV